jgi:tripeptidyl-peptidase I
VNAFLQQNGITAKTLSPAGDWLGFQTTVSKANALFDANFQVFKHEDTGSESIVTMAYSLPTDLTSHVDLVHPTTTYVSESTLSIHRP